MFCVLIIYTVACKSKEKGSIEEADSANQANLDTALKRKDIVIDENSSTYLVRIAGIIMVEKELTNVARHQAVSVPVKDFAAKLYSELSGIYDSVTAIAMRKNIVLPSTISEEGSISIELVKKARGKLLDKSFINSILKEQESLQALFTNAMTESKDADIRSFSDLTGILLRTYTTTAKAIERKL